MYVCRYVSGRVSGRVVLLFKHFDFIHIHINQTNCNGKEGNPLHVHRTAPTSHIEPKPTRPQHNTTPHHCHASPVYIVPISTFPIVPLRFIRGADAIALCYATRYTLPSLRCDRCFTSHSLSFILFAYLLLLLVCVWCCHCCCYFFELVWFVLCVCVPPIQFRVRVQFRFILISISFCIKFSK